MKTILKKEKLKELRHQKGWSQEQLSEMSRLSIRTIQRAEKDGSCAIESLKSIASVFEIDFSDLIFTEDASKKDVEFLIKLEHGKQIADLIPNKHALDFDFDRAIKNPNQIELIYSFFQELQDYSDFWDEIEFFERGKIIQKIQELATRLEESNLYIFGNGVKREYDKSILKLDVLIIRIYCHDNPSIVKVDIADIISHIQ